MYDREKVVHGLELVKEDICERFVSGSQKSVDCLRIDKAIAMLKEQCELRKTYVEACDDLYAIAKNRVDVVRCKDCKFYRNGGCGNIDSESPCRNLIDVKPDWFCAYGEAKA